ENMASLTPNQACMKLANELIVYPPSPKDWDLRGAYDDLLSKIQAASRSPNSPSSGITAATKALTTYFARVVHRQSSHGSKICTLLANTTREVPFWRPLFGLQFRPDVEQNRLQIAGDAHPRLESESPDCVLEVARRVLTNPWNEPSSQLFRSALRLIANCCADNNLNRSVIVRRGGVELMMHLARWARECDLLLPTLFNVCLDFDEPAVDDHGEPWKPLDQMRAEPDSEPDPIVNAAEQRLGMCWPPSERTSSVETLLDLSDHADGCFSTLADLIEMASRVSLYGIQNLVGLLDGTETDDNVEASTIGLIDALLTQGSKLTQKDPECCAPICQAVMNVFSQRPTRKGLINVKNALWQFIHLPYLPAGPDEEITESLHPYKNVILKLVYEVSSLEAYGNKFNADTKLIQDCCALLSKGVPKPGHSPSRRPVLQASDQTKSLKAHPYPSALVLLSNSIISTDRAARVLKTHPRLASHLARLIATVPVSEHEILHPAIDLATRLALCREGQEQLYDAGILCAVDKLLQPTSEANAAGIEVQRETISLIRLVIKGYAEFLQGLTAIDSLESYIEPDSNINDDDDDDDDDDEANPVQNVGQVRPMTRIFHLFYRTTDAATKMAIGRLVIEILRTAAASTTPGDSTSAQQQPSSAANADDTRARGQSALESRLKVILEHFSSPLSPPRQPQPQPEKSTSTSKLSPNPALPIAHIITQTASQTQTQPGAAAQEAEAWFGLGLLSSFPTFHGCILRALAADNQRLLTRLKDIVAEHGVGTAALSVSNLLITDPEPEPESENSVGVSSGPAPHRQQQQQQDARYANVKVLVVRMIQSQPQPQPQPQPQ
ncbi:uncharacterized protein A1O9_09786, partial [Exophiala aquamarina CBS 119918]